jgi:hypothetical protein
MQKTTGATFLKTILDIIRHPAKQHGKLRIYSFTVSESINPPQLALIRLFMNSERINGKA